MDLNTLYLNFLSAMFVFWNSVRILTYVPTILKLKRPGASAKDYSLTTWASWVFSNGFFALYLWEQSQRELNSMVILNCGNTLMCLVTCYYIAKQRERKRSAHTKRTRFSTALRNAGRPFSQSTSPI